jgi:hypothetical protein
VTKKGKLTLWILGIVALGAAVAVILLRRPPIIIVGAVTIQDTDPRKQLPIADVEVSVANGLSTGPVRSDTSGYFRLHLRKWVRKGQVVALTFKNPKYQVLNLKQVADGTLCIARLVPHARTPVEAPTRPAVVISNVRIRYSIKSVRSVNVGSAVRTFQVENVSNVPCDGRSPCSPDGKWKAAVGSISLDAGAGNEFQGVRVSCIAGPCPFTSLEPEQFTHPSQKITASAFDWSDTATFVVEAEVIHTMQSQVDHQSYPVVFGPALSFTLPADAEGVCLEADVSGETIIFPLGPDLLLSWANCDARVNRDQTKVYRCELKPGYRIPQ